MSDTDNKKKEADKNTKMPPTDEVYTGQGYQSSSGKEKKEEKAPSIGKDISILVMITLAAGVLLGAAYGVTKGPIEQAQAQAKADAQSAVMPDADSFRVLYTADGSDGEQLPDTVSDAIFDAGIETTTVSQIDEALDEDQKTIGYVITSSNPDGYGGDVEVMSGITKSDDGVTIEGISFLSLSETAGMGMRAKDDEFLNQFEGKLIEDDKLVEYVKDGAEESHEIDAISGCTITTSAVTDNVNAAVIAANHAGGSSSASAKEASAETEDESEAAAGAEDESESEAAAKDAGDVSETEAAAQEHETSNTGEEESE